MPTTYKTVYFQVHVSSHNSQNLTFTPWRSVFVSKRMGLAVDKAKSVSDASHASGAIFPDRVRVVRIESTCTVLHEIK